MTMRIPCMASMWHLVRKSSFVLSESPRCSCRDGREIPTRRKGRAKPASRSSVGVHELVPRHHEGSEASLLMFRSFDSLAGSVTDLTTEIVPPQYGPIIVSERGKPSSGPSLTRLSSSGRDSCVVRKVDGIEKVCGIIPV